MKHFTEIEKKAEIYKAKQKSDDLKRLRPLLNRQQATDVEVEQSTGHIMISYNKLSRDICMKIKEKLEVCIKSLKKNYYFSLF